MKRQFSLFIIVAMFFLPGITAATAATPHQEGTVDIWIEPEDAYYLQFTILNSPDNIYIDIEVTSGGTIDCYIFDSTNFYSFLYGSGADAEETFSDRSSISFVFSVTEIGYWYLVFDNDALTTRKHIEGWASLAPYPGYHTQVALTVIILLIGLIAIGLVVCYKLTEPKTKQQKPYTYQDIGISTAQSDVAYCPYCGTPRLGDDTKFCTNCGKSIGGPEPE